MSVTEEAQAGMVEQLLTAAERAVSMGVGLLAFLEAARACYDEQKAKS